IDVSLAKRADTLKKQLDVTKAYAKHELDTFSAIVNIRKGMTIQEMQEANAQMDEIQSRINAVAESYPQLYSSKNFMQLQAAINTCEADLSATRRIYNANVAEFNKMIVTFPTTIVAKKLGCQKYISFEATQSQRADVEMTF
ncbi:LemA family protein, partial [Eubacterium sp.]|uniref:LemA family protein n=1 Tax=Eubacterium sp. TaxID=142586 RepID=UPI003EFBD67E